MVKRLLEFVTFPAAKQALDSNPASLDPLVGTRQPLADARGKSSEMNRESQLEPERRSCQSCVRRQHS